MRLESAMIIKVGAGANAQNAHMDTEDRGSVSVHLPLQPLHKGGVLLIPYYIVIVIYDI